MKKLEFEPAKISLPSLRVRLTMLQFERDKLAKSEVYIKAILFIPVMVVGMFPPCKNVQFFKKTLEEEPKKRTPDVNVVFRDVDLIFIVKVESLMQFIDKYDLT